MRPTLSATGAPMGVSARWLLFGAAVTAGAVSGNIVNIEPLAWTYDSLLTLVADPGLPFASLATGVGLGFVLGFIHLTSI
jgi:hypothetical protein